MACQLVTLEIAVVRRAKFLPVIRQLQAADECLEARIAYDPPNVLDLRAVATIDRLSAGHSARETALRQKDSSP